MTNTTKRFPIGAVSEGTMRPEDVIPAMLDTLEELDAKRAGELSHEYAHILDWLDRGIAAISETYDSDDDCGREYEELGFLKDALFDALDELAPSYVYFGTHEDDGACVGFWPDVERLQEDLRMYAPVSRDGETYILQDEGVRVHISDHGNIAVYDLDSGDELWSVV